MDVYIDGGWMHMDGGWMDAYGWWMDGRMCDWVENG